MALHLDYSDLKRVVVEAIIIVCFGMTIGLAFNHRMIMDAFTGQVVATALPGAEIDAPVPVPVALQDVQNLRQRAVVVDARIPEFYAEGHLPAAISFPLAEIEDRLASFKKAYPVTRPVIVYCNGFGCSDSFDLAVELLRAGYNDVLVYEGGYPEWRDAGLPVEEGAP